MIADDMSNYDEEGKHFHFLSLTSDCVLLLHLLRCINVRLGHSCLVTAELEYHQRSKVQVELL